MAILSNTKACYPVTFRLWKDTGALAIIQEPSMICLPNTLPSSQFLLPTP